MVVNSTLSFYKKNAKQFFEQTVDVNMQSLYAPFIEALPNILPNEQHILDLGCGSVRASNYFAHENFNVTAVDGSQELIDLAKQYEFISNAVDWRCLNFLNLQNQGWRNKFTGIWACASLLHIPYKELPNLFKTLARMLIVDGAIYTSFKYGNNERFDNGRFFCDLNEDRWAQVKSQIGTDSIIDRVWITVDRRPDKSTKWLNIIIKNELEK